MFLLADTIAFVENAESDFVRIGLYRSEFNYKFDMKNIHFTTGLYIMTPGWIAAPLGYPLYNAGIRVISVIIPGKLNLGTSFFYFKFAGEKKLMETLNNMLKSNYGDSAPELTELDLNIEGFKSSFFGKYLLKPGVPLNFGVAYLGMPAAEQSSLNLGVAISYELLRGLLKPSIEGDIFYTRSGFITSTSIKISGVIILTTKHFGLKLGTALPGETIELLGEEKNLPLIPFFDLFVKF